MSKKASPAKPKKTTRKPTPLYRVEKSDGDGLFHVFNTKTKYMYKGGWPNKAQCEKACEKLNK